MDLAEQETGFARQLVDQLVEHRARHGRVVLADREPRNPRRQPLLRTGAQLDHEPQAPDRFQRSLRALAHLLPLDRPARHEPPPHRDQAMNTRAERRPHRDPLPDPQRVALERTSKAWSRIVA